MMNFDPNDTKMEKRLVHVTAKPYSDALYEYEITGCSGYTDEQVKAYIGLKSESETPWPKGYLGHYERVSDDKANYVCVIPSTD